MPSYAGPFPAGAFAGQQRAFFDFDSPSLVIRQMPVKPVYVMQGKDIDETFDGIQGEKMPCYVKMSAAVGKTGRIEDFSFREECFAIFPAIGVQRFAERLYPVKSPCRSTGRNPDVAGVPGRG